MSQWQWKCDNCGAWVDDDGSGNDHEGYTCPSCGSCMYPEELARLCAEGDAEAKMTWRLRCEGCKRFMGYNWEGVAGCRCPDLNPENPANQCKFEPKGAEE